MKRVEEKGKARNEVRRVVISTKVYHTPGKQNIMIRNPGTNKANIHSQGMFMPKPEQ